MKFQFIVDNLNGQAPERRISSECHSVQWQIYSGPWESAGLTLEGSLSTSIFMGDVKGSRALNMRTSHLQVWERLSPSWNFQAYQTSAQQRHFSKNKGRASPPHPNSPLQRSLTRRYWRPFSSRIEAGNLCNSSLLALSSVFFCCVFFFKKKKSFLPFVFSPLLLSPCLLLPFATLGLTFLPNRPPYWESPQTGTLLLAEC